MDEWIVPKAPGTHTLMDGGILYVQDEDMDAFFQVYIEQLKHRKLYVVEQKTHVFKFFVDLDYKAPDKLKDEALLAVCEVIHDAIGSPGRCCIARAQPRPVKDPSGQRASLIKSGVHIHWPDLRVTKQEAISLRSRILLALPEVQEVDWAQVIDSSVYGGSGLRMLWSHKKPSGDPYVPWRTLDGSEFSKEPNLETLALFSIRCKANEKKDEVSEAIIASEPIEEFIQRYLPGQRRTQVKKIQRMEEGSDAWYVQTDSKYCERIRSEHRSNHVWFMLNKGRISQRCFNEECKGFVGSEHILPPSIVDEVVTVGSPPSSSFMACLSERNLRPVPEVRTGGASILWPRSNELAAFPK
jgi:Prim-pol 4/Herpesviridae UL52/UL70 DNA primase